MERHCERLGEGGFGQGHLVDRMLLGGFAHQALAKAALHLRETQGAAVEARVEVVALLAGLAETAVAAGPCRTEGRLLQRRSMVTSAPVSTIVPAISWPGIIGLHSRTEPACRE